MSLQKQKKGISLRTIHAWLIIGAIVLSVLMFFSTYDLSSTYRKLSNVTEQHIELRKDTKELMDASDHLTECVQRFTLNGEQRFLNEYFEEAFEARRREKSIEKVSSLMDKTSALTKLQNAMNNSLELMKREYYAMRLVIEAKGYTDYPDEIKTVEILEKDLALSPKEKMLRANEIVLDNEYYRQKSKIRENLQECLNELEKIANDTGALALSSLHDEIIAVRIVIVIQALGVVFLVWLTSRLGIHPILKAVEKIKSDSKLSEVGAREFRYLVQAYNKMYDAYKKSLKRLNFKALHDELTGVYNRAGYNSILSAVDLPTTYMILFDVDNFKSINDTFGHETGDRVLVRLVEVLQENFRSDDFICRIGGDEFVVLMINSNNTEDDLIASKITAINRQLQEENDDLPPISLSVGIGHGSLDSDAESLFEKIDRAMYESKQKGKHTFTFYSE